MFSVGIASYNHGIALTDQSLRGAGELMLDWTLFPDTLITESDASIVASYTAQDDANQAYDSLKWVLVDNYGGEASTYATRAGDTLVTSYDVVLDGTGSGLPVFDGSTITLNTVLFSGNINAPSVTLVNGAVHDGSVNGEYYLTNGEVVTDVYTRYIADTSMSVTFSGLTPAEIEVINGAALTVYGSCLLYTSDAADD